MRTKVLYYAPTLGAMGGSERQLVELASRLDRRRFLPFVWNAGPAGPPAAELRERGVVVLNIALPRTDKGIAAAARRLEAFRPDVFHSMAFQHHCAEVEAAKAAGISPVVVGLVDIRYWDEWGSARPWEARRAELADAFACNCGAVARSAATHQGIATEKLHVIHNGIALAEAPRRASRDSSFVFGNVGNLRPVKGHDVLLRAFAIVARAFPEARLVVVGKDSGALADLRRLEQELGVEGKVEWLGGRSDVAGCLAGFDVYVHPSRSEGLPYAMMEAMAVGLPVVATEVGGVPEVITPGVNGLLAPSEQPELLAECMIRLARDAPLRRQLGDSAREAIANRFSIGHMVTGHERLYERLLRQST